MNISWQWLEQLVDLRTIEPKFLAEQLILAGFEVEYSTIKDKKQIVFEISTTTNRTDTLSIIGMAREISAILNSPLIKQYNQLNLRINHQKITPKYIKCKSYISSQIDCIKITDSPEWLQEKLRLQNIIPINNLIDIINFIYLKWSQHIEVFDLNKIVQNKKTTVNLNTQWSKIGEQFIDRDGMILKIPSTNIIAIYNHDMQIALAGIGANCGSEVTTNTNSIVVQIAIFETKIVEETCQELNIRSNTSILYEKGVGQSDLLDAYSEGVLLISNLCQGIISETNYLSHSTAKYNSINFNLKNIERTLGYVKTAKNDTHKITINKNISLNILDRLNFIIYDFIDYLEVKRPLGRLDDISREIDLIEEISRIYGFDKFISSIPNKKKYGDQRNEKYKIGHLRSILRNIGLNETIHSSLTNTFTKEVEIYNPLIQEYNCLINNLLSGLIETNFYNVKQGNSSVEIFEIGRTFKRQGNQYMEETHVAGIIGGKALLRSEWSHKPLSLSWLQAKGDLEEVFERLGIKIRWSKIDLNFELCKTISKHYHPKKMSMLCLKDEPVGIFGELNIRLSSDNSINFKIYGFELIFDKMKNKTKRIHHFQPYSKYPAIIRDITAKVAKNVSFEQVMNAIRIKNNGLIESIKLLNTYKEEKSQDKSLSFRVTYRSNQITLASKQVDKLEKDIRTTLSDKFK
jgi:phenylalanyl-tRNA synthetase beta chain